MSLVALRSALAAVPSHFSSTLTLAYDTACNVLERTVINAMKQGPMPRHVGFVMDGNRRFAQKINVNTGEGHYAGSKQGEKVLKMCMDLGIDVVTVYAFSIENFKRPKEEVDYLMQLFREKFTELCLHNDTVREYGVQIRFLGNLDLLPPDVADAARKAMEMTKNNTRYDFLFFVGPYTCKWRGIGSEGGRGRVLSDTNTHSTIVPHFSRIFNICCPYTARDEITTAMRKIVQGVERDEIKPEQIDDYMIEQHLFTADCPPLDIWVRTSEYRLSDFLLWQSCRNCHVQFVDCYWPEFSLWKFLPALFEYQVNYAELQRNRSRSRSTLATPTLLLTEPTLSDQKLKFEVTENEQCRRRTPSPVPRVA
ncbi:hypothetical protein BC936DRAFT_142603 [Jimgerdemannia flammicorona]|uniref:Alkyl transferase n=1 Tax=Jimgerdemannia flammicorona TaxID=994334 RepID=A0A433DEW2_9FUNG|nr:hypothetical protein BC936DRAFT_142603 [Jimgerdemannia flammicorona]